MCCERADRLPESRVLLARVIKGLLCLQHRASNQPQPSRWSAVHQAGFEQLHNFVSECNAALRDDFDTPRWLSAVLRLADFAAAAPEMDAGIAHALHEELGKQLQLLGFQCVQGSAATAQQPQLEFFAKESAAYRASIRSGAIAILKAAKSQDTASIIASAKAALEASDAYRETPFKRAGFELKDTANNGFILSPHIA
jgi:cysteinyl-tRNA synthetase